MQGTTIVLYSESIRTFLLATHVVIVTPSCQNETCAEISHSALCLIDKLTVLLDPLSEELVKGLHLLCLAVIERTSALTLDQSAPLSEGSPTRLETSERVQVFVDQSFNHPFSPVGHELELSLQVV